MSTRALPPGVTIDRLRPEEWRDLRRVRLEALEDAPNAFAQTYEAAAAEPDETWRTWAAGGEDGRTVVLVVRHEGRVAGMATTSIRGEDTGYFGAMWLDPSVRGGGAGGALLDAAVVSLRERGATSVTLWVADENPRAEAMYASRGFRRTGTAIPLRETSPLRTNEMARPLDDG